MTTLEAQQFIRFMQSVIYQVGQELHLDAIVQPLLDDLTVIQVNANRLVYESSTRPAEQETELQSVYLLVDALSAVYARLIVPADMVNQIHASPVHREMRGGRFDIENVSVPSNAATFPWALYSAEQIATLRRSFTLMLDATIENISETSAPFIAERANNLIRNYFAGE